MTRSATLPRRTDGGCHVKCNARTSIFAWSSVAVAIIWSAGFSVLKSAISAFAKRFVGDLSSRIPMK
jgi:hypothetical protein